MKILTWCVSVLFIFLIILYCICLKMSNSIVDLKEKNQNKLAELDASKNKLEDTNAQLERIKEDLLRESAKPNKSIKNAAQIFEESQFAVAITSATAMDEALGTVISPNAAGFIIKIDNELFVITAKHVCLPKNGKAEKLLVHFKPSVNGKIINSEPAEILGICPDPSHDIGVLKIKNKNFNFPWTPGIFETSKNLKHGDKIFTLGSPLGNIFCITEGCVINISKIPTLVGGNTECARLITHDALSNYGNSGGPLINDFGKIVGMTSQITVNQINNMAMAVPSDILQSDIKKIIKHEVIRHSKINARLGNSWELNRFSEGWNNDPPNQCGVIVTKVIFGSDASACGLKRGDLILQCAGTPARDADEVIETIMLSEPNSTMEFLVRHDNGVEEKINLQLSPLR